MKEVYQLSKEELFEAYGTEQGLREEAAVQKRKEYGENVLEEKGKKPIWRIFADQFADLIVIILIVAAGISMLSGNMESSIVIWVVLVLNAVLGTVQYVKAEKSLDSLKALSSPKAKVLRDGVKKELASKEIVPGDIVLLEAGDMIVADGRIVSNFSLQVNESSLTGESTNIDKEDIEIDKELALGDRSNMVFSGSLVTYGRANVLVTATGMQTEMGKIASLMNETKSKKTPLQLSLDKFSKNLAIIIMLISALVFGLRISQGADLLSAMMFAVALAVAAVPEALSSIVTIVQAIGTRKMAADNAIIKDLKAVESLGCVSVICSDKTGTLTQNKMEVKQVFIDGAIYQPEELNLDEYGHRLLLYNAILNNDSRLDEKKDIGDPTEVALLTMARKAGLVHLGATEEDVRSQMPRLAELAFDSDRKLMSTEYKVHGKRTLFTKGAVDVLLDRVENIMSKGGVRPITEADKEEILQANRHFSENGLRVLAFAYKDSVGGESLSLESEYGYTFTALTAMVDPPREEATEAVADAIRAGIKPVMITGDHKVTARAIARQIGIYREGDRALTGQELDRMSDEELDACLEKVSVYARVSPENKIRIVGAWQKKGHIVSMTGDGVNDAPALKKADIGVAMGITGTEVSKDAAAMVLADDNFATIMKAVLNGRNVYRNIMNAIQFLLSGNTAAILVVLFCSFAALASPFEPVHLLFINLLTDSLPALAIGMEPSDKRLLENKPRNPKEGILTKKFLRELLFYGILIGSATLLAYFRGLQTDEKTASTMAFAALTLARLFHGMNCRSEYSIAKIGFFSNKWSLLALSSGILLLALVLYIPIFQNLFLAVPLSGAQLTYIFALALAPIVLIQAQKLIKESIVKRK